MLKDVKQFIIIYVASPFPTKKARLKRATFFIMWGVISGSGSLCSVVLRSISATAAAHSPLDFCSLISAELLGRNVPSFSLPHNQLLELE